MDENTLLGGQGNTEPTQAGNQPSDNPQGTDTLAVGDAGNTNPSTTPVVPESYDFTNLGDELDPEVVSSFSDVLKSVSATQEQAAAIAKYGVGYAQQVAQQAIAYQQEQMVQQSNEWAEQTRKELGANLEDTLAKCGTAMEYLERAVPNIREIVNTNGLGNRVELVRAFAKIGELVSEDKGIGGNGAATNQTAADILYGGSK